MKLQMHQINAVGGRMVRGTLITKKNLFRPNI